MQIWTARGEQGYAYRQYGQSDRTLTDFDGLALLTIVHKRGRKKKKDEAAKTDSAPAKDSLPFDDLFAHMDTIEQQLTPPVDESAATKDTNEQQP